jgi:hypothetical protein
VGILVVTQIATSLASTNVPHPNRTTQSKSKCSLTFKYQESKPFIEGVWRHKKWHRGQPTRAVLSAFKHLLTCSAGQGHRKAMKSLWRAEKRSYYQYRDYKRRWGNCSDAGPVSDCIHGAALTYGADESWMINVSKCESGWNRYAVNTSSGSTGLFQFLVSTWGTTPYGDEDIYSAKYQSLAGAWMYVQGRSGEWVCSG